MATIAVLGTLDTKGAEHQYVAECIQRIGHRSLLLDVGFGSAPRVTPDVSRERILEMAGGTPSQGLADKDSGMSAMVAALPKALLSLYQDHQIQGVISVGGECGTEIATAGMRALPLGFPKVMVTPLSGTDMARYVGFRDILLFPSLADVFGLNRLLRATLAQAAGVVCGMIEFSANISTVGEKPLIVASTTPHCAAGIDRAIAVVEGAGYEVLRIPSDGSGGRSLEAIVDSGLAAGVLDMSLREWTDEVLGGPCGAGPTRLEAAALNGVPAVVVPGGVDLAVVPEDSSVLSKWRERTFSKLNSKMRWMRSDAAECEKIGKKIAEKLNLSTGPVSVLLPVRGISALSSPGKPFHDPEADRALFRGIRENLSKQISVKEFKATISDAAFAEACARALLGNIKAKARDFENLQKVEFFEGESEAFLRQLARMLHTEVFLPNDFIIRQDEVGDCMYFLASGSAEVLNNGHRVAKLGSGAPFGEMALVSGERRNASVRAMEYCEVHRLEREDFGVLRANYPAFDMRVKAIVKQRIMSNLHT